MAEDIWEQVLRECTFGGIRIDVQTLHDSNGRALARHVYPHRDGADIDDMGGEPRVTRARVVFISLPGDEDPRDRFASFKELVDRGETQTFVHPLSGPYQAKVGEFDYSIDADERDTITVDCTFEEDTTEPAVFDLGPGSPSLAGSADVAASAAAVSTAMDDAAAEEGAPLTRTPPDDDATQIATDAAATSAAWEDPSAGKTWRQINLELVALSNRIAAETTRLEVATNLRRYPLMTTLGELHYNLRQAARAITESTPRLYEIRVLAPSPLITIAAREYGADDAEARVEELLQLNDIRNPTRIEAGTTLKAQVATGTARRTAA